MILFLKFNRQLKPNHFNEWLGYFIMIDYDIKNGTLNANLDQAERYIIILTDSML